MNSDNEENEQNVDCASNVIAEPLSSTMTWGRRAVQRYSKSPQQIRAEILNSLKEKLSYEYQSYAQWERISPEEKAALKAQEKQKLKAKKAKKKSSNSKNKFRGNDPVNVSSKHKVRKLVSHKQNYNIKEGSHVLMLRMQIESKMKSIQAFEGLVEATRQANYGMRAEISKLEKDAYTKATQDLERGCAYQVGGKLRRENHAVRMDAIKRDLEATKVKTEHQIAVLEREIAAKEAEILSTQQDLLSLGCYKDKEYPVTSLKIKKLNNRLNLMNAEHLAECAKMNELIGDEMDKLDVEVGRMAVSVVDRAAEKVFSESGAERVEKTLKSMAVNNKQLRIEIGKQKDIIKTFERVVLKLEAKNNDMIANKTGNVRHVAFQDVIGIDRDKKFLPDDELVLDIPLPRELPI